jgi:RecB family exonuclease
MTNTGYLQPMGSLSPSRYSAMQECRLREVLAASRASASLPRSPAALVGSLIHQLLEDARRGRFLPGQASEHLNQVVSKFEASLPTGSADRRWLPLMQTVEFRAKVKTAVERAEILCIEKSSSQHQGQPHQRVGIEAAANARGGKVRGRMDRVHRNAGLLTIEDLKTGPIFSTRGPERLLKPHYVEQLKLYAAMYAEDENLGAGEWPERLELTSVSGARAPVEFSRTECVDLLDKATALLDATNELINTSGADVERHLAAPSAEACAFCVFRPSCGPYLASTPGPGVDGWPVDVSGRLVEKRVLGNGRLSLTLIQESGVPAYIRGLTPAVHALREVLVGSASLGVFSARLGPGTNTFSEGRFTTVVPCGAAPATAFGDTDN